MPCHHFKFPIADFFQVAEPGIVHTRLLPCGFCAVIQLIIALISVNQLAVSVLPPLVSAHTITATAAEFFRPDVVACMNTCQMTLFPVFRKNFIATDALFPYLTASVPLLLAYNRLEIAFHIQICIFIAVSYFR